MIEEETVAETTAQVVEDTKPTVEADGNTDKIADADPKLAKLFRDDLCPK